ncbi:DUF4249 domain-containing protein [Membranicola marinus]|uniref:DUF4249 domain-containing protein n=1 Tax=Membranihabitans marinus TaxID=1227546 RepID=A0A953HPG3_9BACT|nr:DUF4249 family protein [Membranihabitans marinus]MBY5959362.1 DUF4249 domain-containing protein [Membranihabitans marinus]
MKFIQSIFLSFCLLQLIGSCNLDKEIQIDIPEFENGYVIESYLSPGQKLGVLVTKSYGFFEVFDSNQLSQDQLIDIFVQDADGYVEINDQRHPLINEIQIVPGTTTVYNYVVHDKLNLKEKDRIKLFLSFPSGDQVWSETSIPEKRLIDSLRLEKNQDMKMREVSFIHTDSSKTEYFRRQLLRIRDNRIKIIQDFMVDNSTLRSGKLAFGSGYEFKMGDTLISRVSHIREEYFDFYQSVTGSINANSNPFGQPGSIAGNIRGSDRVIGIFTGINQSEIFTKIAE